MIPFFPSFLLSFFPSSLLPFFVSSFLRFFVSSFLRSHELGHSSCRIQWFFEYPSALIQLFIRPRKQPSSTSLPRLLCSRKDNCLQLLSWDTEASRRYIHLSDANRLSTKTPFPFSLPPGEGVGRLRQLWRPNGSITLSLRAAVVTKYSYINQVITPSDMLGWAHQIAVGFEGRSSLGGLCPLHVRSLRLFLIRHAFH